MIKARILNNNKDVSYLDNDMLQDDLLIVKDASFYKDIPQQDLAIWCHYRGIYNLPTTELIEWLKGQTIYGETIEVGDYFLRCFADSHGNLTIVITEEEFLMFRKLGGGCYEQKYFDKEHPDLLKNELGDVSSDIGLQIKERLDACN